MANKYMLLKLRRQVSHRIAAAFALALLLLAQTPSTSADPISSVATQDVGAGGGGHSSRVSLGGDLSGNRSSNAIYIGKARMLRVAFLWPASSGGARPTGKFWIKTNVTQDTDGFGLIEQFQESQAAYWPAISAAQPVGDGIAGKLDLDNIETCGEYVQLGYEATSGGAGVVPTAYIYVK